MIVKKNCLNCKKIFETKPYYIKRGGGKFCSIQCVGIWKSKNTKTVKIKKLCKVCGNEITFFPSNIKNGSGKFCSYKCKGIWQSKYRGGENNPHWKGGEVKKLCLICRKEFSVCQAKVKIGVGRFCSLHCFGMWIKKHMPNKNTSIELKVEEYLKQLGIKYESQKIIPEGRTVADFYIPEQHLVLYADGLYWHNKPGAKEKDTTQNFLLRKNGFNVLRLKEKEINENKEGCLEKIQKSLVN